MKRIVIALGGNALIGKGEHGTATQQQDAVKQAINRIKPILRRYQVVITHGNGPQVGNLLLQQHSTSKVPDMPLDVLDAMTQGEIGYFIVSALSDISIPSIALVTRVTVSPKDRAFRNPSKPIGPFYKKPVRKGMKPDANRGYRLVVPSPEPIGIIEKDGILSLLEDGFVVVAAGGGGIPISKGNNGIEAVIDKDKASALLATTINADLFILLTSVDNVFLNFGKKDQKPVRRMSIREAEDFVLQSQFAEGNMKPKIESAIRFVKKTKGKAIICSIKNAEQALNGKAGTVIEP